MQALRRKGLTGHPERRGCRERQVGTPSMGPEPSPEAHFDTPSGLQGSQGLVLRNLEPHPHPISPSPVLKDLPPCHPQPLKTGLRGAGGGSRWPAPPTPQRGPRTTLLACTQLLVTQTTSSCPDNPKPSIILQIQKLRLREVQPLCFSQDLGSTAYQLQAGLGRPLFQ